MITWFMWVLKFIGRKNQSQMLSLDDSLLKLYNWENKNASEERINYKFDNRIYYPECLKTITSPGYG